MWRILGIGLGGFFGAVGRYWISGWVYRLLGENFPYGTLAVNVLGSFVLGLVMGILEGVVGHPDVRAAVTIGFLGAFTTFSTFSYETMMLFQVGDIGKAFLNILVSVVLGLLFVGLGLFIGRWWVG